MKFLTLGDHQVSSLILGCMRLAGRTAQETEVLVNTALDCGINHFDHADIYGQGQCESLFGRVLQADPGLRDRMVLQSKLGICKGYYDFSYDHIMTAAEGILRRLHTDHLDLLLFHRPDALAEQEEFARAIQDLKAQGKALAFGVSNMNPAQIRLLESWSGETMLADQMQLSLVHAGLVTSGINVNIAGSEGTMYDGSLLPYAQQRGMAIQAWSPLQDRIKRCTFLEDPDYPELNDCLRDLAREYGVSPAAIALAWILRIPGKLQVILGTVTPGHLKEAVKASDLVLTREQWYRLYRSCGYRLP